MERKITLELIVNQDLEFYNMKPIHDWILKCPLSVVKVIRIFNEPVSK